MWIVESDSTVRSLPPVSVNVLAATSMSLELWNRRLKPTLVGPVPCRRKRSLPMPGMTPSRNEMSLPPDFQREVHRGRYRAVI